jgi:DNA-binding phage protein
MWFKKDLPELGKVELERLQARVGFSYFDMNLVGQYENAINILINNIIEEKNRVDLIAHLLLYL